MAEDRPLPLAVSFLSDAQCSDDDSQLTDPREDDDEEDCGGLKLSWDGAVPGAAPHRNYRPVSRRRLTEEGCREEERRRELVDLKLQIARQREELDLLASELSRAKVENEALRAENGGLVEELAVARDTIDDLSLSSSAAGRIFPLRGLGNGKGGRASKASGGRRSPNGAHRSGCSCCGAGGGGGSMQMLADSNARLAADNARLQVSIDGVRNSFQSYIKYSGRRERADEEAAGELRRENEALRRKLSVCPRRSLDDTAPLSFESAEQGDAYEAVGAPPRPDAPDRGHDDDRGANANECDDQDRNAKSIKSREDLSEIGGAKSTTDRDDPKCKAPAEERGPNNGRSSELLVDFGETRRARVSRSKARRWHSVTF